MINNDELRERERERERKSFYTKNSSLLFSFNPVGSIERNILKQVARDKRRAGTWQAREKTWRGVGILGREERGAWRRRRRR